MKTKNEKWTVFPFPCFYESEKRMRALKIQSKNLVNTKMEANYLNFVFHIEVKIKSKYKILNFVFQFIKNTKWHYGYTDFKHTRESMERIESHRNSKWVLLVKWSEIEHILKIYSEGYSSTFCREDVSGNTDFLTYFFAFYFWLFLWQNTTIKLYELLEGYFTYLQYLK